MYQTIADILKSGVVKPTDVEFNGVLTPAQSETLLKDIQNNGDFLKKITYITSPRLTMTRTTPKKMKGSLVRHVAGVAPTADQYANNGVTGVKLDMTRTVELNSSVARETLIDNKNRPSYPKEYANALAVTLSNDIVYLGWIGIADNDTQTAPFNELAKGWLTVASESAESVKATYASGITIDGDRAYAMLKTAYDNTSPDIRMISSLNISSADYAHYIDYIEKNHQNTTVLLDGKAMKFKGLDINVHIDMPEGTCLSTPNENVLFSICDKIQLDRWYENKSSSMDSKYSLNPDYEFDIHRYVAIVTEAV